MSDIPQEKPRNGRIVTFYSYKGGTGRTMALANVAWILASNGLRVLAADWDLESPGLHRFFAPFLEQSVRDAPGIIDLVRDYEWVAASSTEEERLETHIPEHARIQKYAIPLRRWTFPGGGGLEFLSAGKQNRDYMATLSALDWDTFYETLNGGEFLDAVRSDMRRQYDYTLIDSRTGLSDVADICTVQLPDVLVDCFTLSTQGLDGAADVARRIADDYGYRSIRVLPVPMRVDLSEWERVEASRTYAQRLFENLPGRMSDEERRVYWNTVEVPYRAYYSYEEMLAVFGDKPGLPTSMLTAYERIAAYVTDDAVTSLPVIDEDLRNATRAKFDRKVPLETRQIIVEFLPRDQIWAEWIMAVLGAGGFAVRERRLNEADTAVDDLAPTGWRTLTVASAAYLAWRRDAADQGGPAAGGGGGGDGGDQDRTDGDRQSGDGRADFMVYVAGGRSLHEFPSGASVSLVGARDEQHAIQLLERLFHIVHDGEEQAASLPRYPGYQPRIFPSRERNEQFTGRERDLRALRDELRSYGPSVLRPIALLGTAGVGKTSEALEYAYRFQNDYDLVAWIDCQRAAEIDHQVADLASRLSEGFGVAVPATPTVQERARLVLDVLSDGVTIPHWLVIYDNAENIQAVRDYLPSSGGQVLITSKNQGWADQAARSITVDIFDREESIAHLRRVVPAMTRDEAGKLANVLGNLPVAVTMVAAFLRDTFYPVADYLEALAKNPARALQGVDPRHDYPPGVLAAWDLSLAELRTRSQAAARLIEICSVLAPNVALPLVYGRPMAELLEPYDPALSEPLVMAGVILEASRLNLLKRDSSTNEIQVHEMLQSAVQSQMSAEKLAETRADAQRLLLRSRPRRDVDDPATWSRYRLLWPHMDPAGVLSSPDDKVRQLIVDRIRYIYVLADYKRGVVEADEAAAQWEEMLAVATDETAARALRTQLLQLRYNLANILRALSRFEEARAIDDKVLAEQTQLLGQDHPHTLLTALGLAADYRALGRYPEALRLDSVTYPACARQFGEGHQRTLHAGNNLAVSYRITGNVYQALRLDEENLRRFTTTLGEQDPRTLLAARNVVRDRLEEGTYDAAVTEAGAVYWKCVEQLGGDSPAALDAQVLLGIALRSAGRAEEAADQFDEARRRLTSRFDENSSATLACRLSNSANLISLERYGEAVDEMLPVLAAYQSRRGVQHPHSLVCHVNLATALHLRADQDQDQALAQINLAVGGLEGVLGAQHPYTLAAEMVYAVLLADAGDLEEAEKVETRAADTLAHTLGDSHPDTLRCRANLLLTRQQRGGQQTAAELDQVIAEREQVIADLELAIGAEHPTVTTLREGRRVLRALDPQPY
jgi:MinD-like ATPase involved in chromosome partitioning or flagellar assembly/tetratricopeptide (TPR) repeat protein